MATEIVNQTGARTVSNLEKAHAIINLVGAVGQRDELAAGTTEIAAWAASDLIDEVLDENFSQVSAADRLAGNLRKVEAIADVMMAADNPAPGWTYNAAWAIRGLMKQAREANQELRTIARAE